MVLAPLDRGSAVDVEGVMVMVLAGSEP